MMKKHKFRITVEHLEDAHGNAASDAPMAFFAENHDDIIDLAARTGATSDKDRAFLVGLKLLGETLLEDKDNQLFSEFREHFGSFMKRLKQSKSKAP